VRAQAPPRPLARRLPGAAGPAGARRLSSRTAAPGDGCPPLDRRRLGTVLAVACLALGVVAARLAWVQGVAADRFARAGSSELMHQVVVPASRGAIYDSAGNELAVSLPQTTVVADPMQVTNPKAEAAALAPILGLDPSTLQTRLISGTSFAYVARQVTDQQAARVRALHLPGISFIQEDKRFLADGSLALPVIGTVGVDGQGLSGIEYQYDRLLSGRDGRQLVEQGSNGAEIPGGLEGGQAARPGQGLVLTLSQPLQYEAEQALAAAIVKDRAAGGSVTVEDSSTGDILAMADLVAGPRGGSPGPSPSNSAAVDVFEPGSVMKSFAVAGALEDHVIGPEERFSVPDTLNLYGDVFHDAEAHPTQSMSVTDILAQSSNVGAITIARALGKDRLYHYLREFGFGSYSPLRFPGESPGLLADPSKWSGTAIATVPIGQDEAVTAVQLLDAYNAIANGGVMVAPRLVEATVGPGGARHPLAPAPRRRVVSSQTAAQLTQMLEQVVQSPAGTGTAAAIPGYPVAGKTGTAQKPLPGGRGYQPGAYMASFVGFVPAERPALTVAVVLDQPTPIFGGEVAAPVFAQVAQYGLRLLEVPPPGTVPPVAQAPAGGVGSQPPANKLYTD
jgi:cell division protein FtsI (penicillin-binding protein 3)